MKKTATKKMSQKTSMKKAAKAALAALLSPQARRYEAALLLLVYEAVRAAFGNP